MYRQEEWSMNEGGEKECLIAFPDALPFTGSFKEQEGHDFSYEKKGIANVTPFQRVRAVIESTAVRLSVDELSVSVG